MYAFASRPTLVCPSIGVKRTLLMSPFLFLQWYTAWRARHAVWFVKWEESGCTAAALYLNTFGVYAKQHEAICVVPKHFVKDEIV